MSRIIIKHYKPYPKNRYNELYKLAYPEDEGWFKMALRCDWIKESFLAYKNNKVIGWSAFFMFKKRLSSVGVYVKSEYRHKGLGGVLLNKVLEGRRNDVRWFNRKGDGWSTRRNKAWKEYRKESISVT